MSLAGIGEVYNTLQEIDVMIGKLEIKTDSFRARMEHATGSVREFEYIFYRVTSLMRRMGLPPNIEQTLQVLARVILTIRMVHSAFIYMTSMTPYGWFMGLVSLAGAGISVGSLGDMTSDLTVGR